MAKLSQAVLIGRTNVGKSTLFNRLTSSAQAIVSDQPNTTRDRKEANVIWMGRSFALVDTGGLNINSQDHLDLQIVRQAMAGLKKSDLIIFVVNAKDGIHPIDKELADWLRKFKTPTIVVANKADNKRAINSVSEFYELGLGQPWPVSAINGVGSGDLLDELTKKIKSGKFKEVESLKISIVGKPNAGKSSLINALVNEERLIVSDRPHTTRDSQDIELIFEGQPITLIDTAGLRRRSKKGDLLEKQSVVQSMQSLKRAGLAILVTEVDKTLTFQDKQIAEDILANGNSVIIVGNKWDKLKDTSAQTRQEMINYYHKSFPWLTWAPIIFMSALNKTKTNQLLKLAVQVQKERFKELPNEELEEFLRKSLRRHKPSKGKGTKQPTIYGFTQTGINPPTFSVKIHFKSSLHASYPRYLENGLRRQYDFTGTPIKIIVDKVRI